MSILLLVAGFAPRPTRLDFDMPPLHTTSIALQNDNDKSSSSSSSAAAAPTTAPGHHPSPAYHHGSHHRPASYSPTKGPAPPIPHHQHGHHGGVGPHMQSGDYDPWANATSLSPQMPSPMMQPPKPTPRTSTLQQQQQQQHQYHGSSSIDVNKNSSNNNFSVTSPAAPDHQYNNNNSNNTSRVMVNQPGQHVQQQMPPAAQAEPVYELEKKGHTSVIRVSYPLPSEPSVTFPTLPPSAAQDTPPIPPARRNAGNVPAATSMAAGATAMPPQLAKFPTLQIRSDSQMGLDNFKFCTVLGRGHFGKVSWRH